ncbi:Diverged AAA-family ATPase containing protein [Pseudomonas veronii 1YdBTEX2]|uniref:AAA family ATPase n=2 Tax=Pseudomonas veronii TaxID=76761 RepID=A0A7Y1AD85_PSEVE|nr:hypothetical protein [Pseudomonas veronii]NMY13619.1 AAA family ATPase [Pseudomonas veronii]SBW84722.1 Diverged AAA-family ATPase containing protein [Pseudomonas veronii 1YdBTEX2]
MIDEIYKFTEEKYFTSGDFNGLTLHELLIKLNLGKAEVIAEIRAGIENDVLTIEHQGNPHIKPFSDVKKDKMIEFLDESKGETNFCMYPHPKKLESAAAGEFFRDAPFTYELAKGAGQLDFRAFDLSTLEFYRNDPRYHYETNSIQGQICVTDEHFESEGMPEHDQVLLQGFGFAYDNELNRYAGVILRYLNKLSPEHQRIWAAKQIKKGEVWLHPEYFAMSFQGSWGTKLSIFDAFVQELDQVNKMCERMEKPKLFRDSYCEERIRGFEFLLRPTKSEFGSFVHLLDKMMSDNISKDFFRGDLELERDVTRKSDGKVIVEPKGTIQLLDEWLHKFYRSAEREDPVKELIDTFRKIRKLRQEPAHRIGLDIFDQSIFREQRALIIEAYNAVRLLRMILALHPKVEEDPPQINDWLREGKIWDF